MQNAPVAEDPNLKIDDAFFNDIGAAYMKEGKVLNDSFNRYLDILSAISDQAVEGGAIHDATKQFAEAANLLKVKISEISALAQKTCNGFITQVDNDDRYLY